MSNISRAIEALSGIGPSELDAADIETLVQLQFWCFRTLAPLAVKTTGRLVAQLQREDLAVGQGCDEPSERKFPEGTVLLSDIREGSWCTMVHPDSKQLGPRVQRIATEPEHVQAGRLKWRRDDGQIGYWVHTMPVLPAP